MLLGARNAELARAAVDHHTVYDLVVAAKMEMVRIGRSVDDEIVLPMHALRALVVVHSPTAVRARLYIHYHIVGDNRAVRSGQRIDAAHVGHLALADVRDAVERDFVALGV